MNDKNAFPCLSEKEIGVLAFKILSTEGTGGDVLKGSMEEIPESLFVDGPESKQLQHLNECTSCRQRLSEELQYLKEYEETVGREDHTESVQKLLLREWGKIAEVRILKLDRYSSSSKPGLSLAASTAESRDEPLRFSTESGDLILKEVRDEKADLPALILIGPKEYTRNSEVIISGQSYLSNENGIVRIDKRFLNIGEGDVVVVCPKEG
ncbi:MAG: hypothetical protein GF417_08925 [Candidatus Latescibacteria bacterium]|nr:hypothetical protein [Candidatus Latescibacterota bacterium]